MEYLKNLNSAFKLVKILSLSIVLMCFVFVLAFYYMSEKKVNESREKVYVLSSGSVLDFALSKNMEVNRPAEIKNHLETFNRLFFEFDPDPKDILERIDKALVLIDNSGSLMHSNRRESLYYHRIVEGSISSRIQVDSIKVDISSYPYRAQFFGKQKLIRPSNVILKNLIASCNLRNTKRTDDNPHGLFIENFQLINNETIDEKSRN